MSGWWTLSIPNQRDARDELLDALLEHEYVARVETGVDHVWALIKDPGGRVDLEDVLHDTAPYWGTPRVAWGHANDTGMHGDVEIYGETRDGGATRVDEYAEIEQGWQGRKAEAWALLNYNIDARIDWWFHFEDGGGE